MISKNPYSKQIIKNYKSYNKYETIQLINDAQKSFELWRNLKLKRRINIIEKIKNNLISKKIDCASKITEEMQQKMLNLLRSLDE